jgi:hypothetical protein
VTFREFSAITTASTANSETPGDAFWEEFNAHVRLAGENPKRFHFERANRRRVNLQRFPYHFLFREIAGGIRITVLRHHKQHPDYGVRRA